MMIAIIDYGAGNLFSLKSSLGTFCSDVCVTSDISVLQKADKLILPGVGAFADAIKALNEQGLDKFLIDTAKGGKPLLGICLGMQLLFEKSFEYGEYNGLELIKGSIVPIRDAVADEDLKIPHIGWNALNFTDKKDSCPIFKYVNEGDFVYFVHSYFASGCDESTVAVAQYGAPLTAAVFKDNIFGCQFHPEKSGEVGLKILKAFCEL